MRLPVLVVCFLLPACGSTPAAVLRRMDAAEGYSLAFPGDVQTRSGREGPFVFRIDSARTSDGARFEAAWFGFPEPLDPPGREALLRSVERGLTGTPGTTLVSRAALPTPPDQPQSASCDAARSRSCSEGVDLVLDRDDGKRGFHRVLYPSPHAMLQVSAVGPRDGDWEADVPRFWSSVTLPGDATPPPESPPRETENPPRETESSPARTPADPAAP